MDLLSNLPDDVLGHILSFLTTKEAALTSVLSKRWRNLLAFVPNLDFDDDDFLQPEEGKEQRDDIQQLFMGFVDRVLALQGNTPINKFSLSCYGIYADRLDCWIQNVMLRGVLEIHLSISRDWNCRDSYNLFPKVFENKKLVKLELRYGIDIFWLDGSFFLPMLKTLVLHLVKLSVDKFEILLHALPSLEELVLNDVYWKEEWDANVNVSISSASLKTLTIKPCCGFDTFSFVTPNLLYLCYSDFVADDYSLVTKMENLFEARISLWVSKEDIKLAREPNNDWLDDDIVLRHANVGKLMNVVRNVRYLVLSPDTLEVLSLYSESMSVFNNLKKLAVKSDKNRTWQAMPILIRNSPHLETLVLEGLLHHVTEKCGDACNCVSREDRGRSLTSCPVKVLEIKRFQGTMKEIHMIKHFLNYFPCLKEIKIYMEENVKVTKVSEVIAEKMELNKKSSSCNIELLLNGDLYKKWTAQ